MAEVYKFDRRYGIQSMMFNYEAPVYSPVFGDVERVSKYDETGKEIISFVPVDYSKIVAERGSVFDWELDSMLKAGINPDFHINTGSSVSRIEGAAAIQEVSNQVDALFAEPNNVEEIK